LATQSLAHELEGKEKALASTKVHNVILENELNLQDQKLAHMQAAMKGLEERFKANDHLLSATKVRRLLLNLSTTPHGVLLTPQPVSSWKCRTWS
jgi:citrate lyase synthetase